MPEQLDQFASTESAALADRTVDRQRGTSIRGTCARDRHSPLSGPSEPGTPEPDTEDEEPSEALRNRLSAMPGLSALVDEAEATWRARAHAAGEPSTTRPGWRAFEDSFPTFYEFTNRPR